MLRSSRVLSITTITPHEDNVSAGEKNKYHELGYNMTQILTISLVICGLAFTCFVPYMLNIELHDGDPSTPYFGAVDMCLVDTGNAVVVSFTSLMLFEAILDSNTLYLPIYINFPRFIMVLGILVSSLCFYFNSDLNGMEKLNLVVSVRYAKSYFICTGSLLQLIKDAYDNMSSKFIVFYISATCVLVLACQIYLWKPHYENNTALIILTYILEASTVVVCASFLIRIVYLLMVKETISNYNHYCNLMSHVIICIFVIPCYVISESFGSKPWKETKEQEFFLYNIVEVCSVVLFFFTSSRIAQQHFVHAKYQLSTKKSFVRYISHEIRTPLNTVYLGIQLLSKEMKLLTERKSQETNSSNSSTTVEKIAEKLGSMLTDIEDSCTISINILNDLLLIDKIEEGNLVLQIASVNAKDFIEPCIMSFGIQAVFSKVNFAVDLEALRNVVLNIDETKIAQVIRNVISNALKFTPPGGHIQVEAHFLPLTNKKADRAGGSRRPPDTEEAGTVRIEILDTGPGISEENKAKLFENVIQFNPKLLQNGGGSGLGLWITNSILKRHSGGKVSVMPGGVMVAQDPEGGVKLHSSATSAVGSAFYIELDCVRNKHLTNDNFGINDVRGERGLVSIEDMKKEDITLTTKSQASDSKLESIDEIDDIGNTTRIDVVHDITVGKENFYDEGSFTFTKCMFDKCLIVEDSKLNRKMLVRSLSPYVREICQAEDGLQGVELVRQCMASCDPPYDIIFMDSVMPNMNGIDATKIIVGELKFPNPVIAITGNMVADDVEEFMRAGALTVLGKPLQIDKLSKVLSEIRAKREKERRTCRNVLNSPPCLSLETYY